MTSTHYRFVDIIDLSNFLRLSQGVQSIYTTEMQLMLQQYQLYTYNLVFEIDLSHHFQYPHIHAGEMVLFDLFDTSIYPLIHITPDEQNLTISCTLLTRVFPSLTTIF